MPAGNLNYFFDNVVDGSCQNIEGLGVTVQVTQDIASDDGFTIQLNANSPLGSEPDAWQQYAFSISGNSIQAVINNWQDVSTAIVCQFFDLCSTPIPNGIPAGYTLSIQLQYDSSGNVSGANYQVFDNNGIILADSTFLIQDAGCQCGIPCLGFCAGDLSPFTAFTLTIVGPPNGGTAHFSSGAGNISYRVSGGQITPVTSLPSCVESQIQTTENSNASYGQLNGCSRQFITQPFFVTPQTPKVCFTTNGPCTGAGGPDQCITIAGATQCCHSNWLWGWFPFITSCSDGTVQNQGCGGPCW